MLRHDRRAASAAATQDQQTTRETAPAAESRPNAIDVSRDVEEDESPAILTVDELAALLRVERKTVYAAITRGDIPGVRRVGRSIRISRDAVLNWLRTAHVRAPHPRRIR